MKNTRQARLLALDVDGTLLTDELQITPATRKAVQQVISQGVQVVLASARGPNALSSAGLLANIGTSQSGIWLCIMKV